MTVKNHHKIEPPVPKPQDKGDGVPPKIESQGENSDSCQAQETNSLRSIYNKTSQITSTMKEQAGQNQLLSRFMAAKGGFMILGAGLTLLVGTATAVVSSGILFTVLSVTTALTAVAIGGIGLVSYGGRLLRGLRNTGRALIGKPPLPEKPKPKKDRPMSVWQHIGKTKAWNKFVKSNFAQKVNSSSAFQRIKNAAIWKHINDISSCSEVRMRTYATGGSIGTIAVASTLLITNVVAVPAVILSLGTLAFVGTIANLCLGIFATKDNTKELVSKSKAALIKGKTQTKSLIKAPTPITVPTQANVPEQVKEKFAANAHQIPANQPGDQPANQNVKAQVSEEKPAKKSQFQKTQKTKRKK